MTDFQMEMTKILVDKALLGAVAMMFGYYLSKRLEMLRTQKTYELFVWEQRAEAAKSASRLITEHSAFLREFVSLAPKLAGDSAAHSEERNKLISQLTTLYPHFHTEMQSILPFLPPRLIYAIDDYLTLSKRVEDIIASGVIDLTTFPKSEDVSTAANRFVHIVGSVFENGPHLNNVKWGNPKGRQQSARPYGSPAAGSPSGQP
jgi:hypothetical protein